MCLFRLKYIYYLIFYIFEWNYEIKIKKNIWLYDYFILIPHIQKKNCTFEMSYCPN